MDLQYYKHNPIQKRGKIIGRKLQPSVPRSQQAKVPNVSSAPITNVQTLQLQFFLAYKPAPVYDESPKPYSYEYGVTDQYSGSNFRAAETADGKAVQGSYQVRILTIN